MIPMSRNGGKSDARIIQTARRQAGEERARGSCVRWSRDWDTSLGDDLLDRVDELLND